MHYFPGGDSFLVCERSFSSHVKIIYRIHADMFIVGMSYRCRGRGCVRFEEYIPETGGAGMKYFSRNVLCVSGIVLSVLLVGCGDGVVTGTGLEGTWTGGLQSLLDLVELELPVAVVPASQLVLIDGKATITLTPENWFLRLLVKGVVEGSYVPDNSTALDKMHLSLDTAYLKILFFTVPIAIPLVETECIYKVEGDRTLYLFPGYDQLPENVRALLEASPASIPWEGITVEGVTYKPLTFTRVTA